MPFNERSREPNPPNPKTEKKDDKITTDEFETDDLKKRFARLKHSEARSKIASLWAQGKTANEIADEIGRTPNGVEAEIRLIYTFLNISKRTSGISPKQQFTEIWNILNNDMESKK